MADFNWKKIVNILAYIALVAVAVSLILTKLIHSNQISNAFSVIASCIAYFITAIAAFSYARSKRSPWVMIVYVIVLASLS